MWTLSFSKVAMASAALGSLLLLSGCVTLRGPQDLSCPTFFDKVYTPAPGRFVADIQSDGRVLPPAPSGIKAFGGPLEMAMLRERDPLAASMSSLVDSAPDGNKGIEIAPQRDVLLLSGGGQWGAYGAGLFASLAADSKRDLALANVGVITGISTGSLQTMLLMVALDESKSRKVRKLAMERLVWGYSPDHEREVVRNTTQWFIPLFGSQAATGPLRQRIRDALCPTKECTLIDEIRSSKVDGYIGFVSAKTGAFQYVDVREQVARAGDNDAAVECLAAAAMASSAMPVFHQQLRVRGRAGAATLYDGGVRRSVFYEKAMEAMDDAVKEHLKALPASTTLAQFAAAYAEKAPVIYVVRNGPTTRDEKSELDDRRGPLKHGMRGYDLLVNEAEIGSIAALRLHNPFGRIRMTTADNWEGSDGAAGLCTRATKGDHMFSPDFMECLRGLGHRKVHRAGGPWWDLRPIDPLGVMAGEARAGRAD